MSFLIKAENIHKTYFIKKKRVSVLKGTSVNVLPGETLSIMGLSGAGKSTLLHILGGLDKPDDGKVIINGKSLYNLSGGKRSKIRAQQIGFIFQSYHLLPEMDIVENVMLPAMTCGTIFSSHSKLRLRAMSLLKDVGLADRGTHTPMELSGGEQQRVALARALMNNPKIVFADEPTGNLDNTTGLQVLDYLFNLTKEKGHALVLVTHNESIGGACDKTLYLEKGVLSQPESAR